MLIKKGDVLKYKDGNNFYIYRILKINQDRWIDAEILQTINGDRYEVGEILQDWCTIKDIRNDQLMKGYNTPLWRVLND